jgi:hypothetical protein
MNSVARNSQVHAPVESLLCGFQEEPFRSADEAWFWTMAALVARREGARFGTRMGKVLRPCEPDDVLKPSPL